MGKKGIKISSHLYDLGSYQFNENDDLDLLNYNMITLEQSEELSWRRTSNSTAFTLKSSSIVPLIYTPTPTFVLHVPPITSSYERNRNLMKGLAATIEKVNEKIRLLSGEPLSNIGSRGFQVTEYAKILTADRNCTLFFPVEVIKNVKIGEEIFEVCINLDNPTSLDTHNQRHGCQGSHFGYTIIIRSSGSRTRGHILITTFVGYPSRNEKERAAVMKDFEERTENSRAMNVEKLFNSAVNSFALPFCITTDKGIDRFDKYSDNIYLSERVKKLPPQLKALHVTSGRSHFELPHFKDKKSKPFLSK